MACVAMSARWRTVGAFEDEDLRSAACGGAAGGDAETGGEGVAFQRAVEDLLGAGPVGLEGAQKPPPDGRAAPAARKRPIEDADAPVGTERGGGTRQKASPLGALEVMEDESQDDAVVVVTDGGSQGVALDNVARGARRRAAVTMAGRASKATTSAPVAVNRRVTWPVPHPSSSTRCVGLTSTASTKT
jgi:hypothetical protein